MNKKLPNYQSVDHSKTLSISAFDLDHTLLADNSSYSFLRYLYKEQHLSLGSLGFIIGSNLRYQAGLLSIPQLHKKAFDRLFKGRSSIFIKERVDDFLQENFERLLYLPAIEKLKLAQEAGHLTVILSSTPNFLVEPIAKKLKVTGWYATEYAIDIDNKFCRIAKLMLGEGKASILHELGALYNVPNNQIHAYSDSHHDLPFLMAAGKAYGVNPNRKLRSICRKNNWSII